MRTHLLPTRSSRGSSLITVAVGLMVAIPVLLVIFDLSMIALGTQRNDSVCREAARIAANGNPLDAQTRAQVVVNLANTRTSGLVPSFKIVQLTNTITAQNIAQLGTYGGQLHGQVTVQTDVAIQSLVTHWVMGGQNPMHFRSQQTMPVTYVVPNTTQSQTGP